MVTQDSLIRISLKGTPLIEKLIDLLLIYLRLVIRCENFCIFFSERCNFRLKIAQNLRLCIHRVLPTTYIPAKFPICLMFSSKVISLYFGGPKILFFQFPKNLVTGGLERMGQKTLQRLSHSFQPCPILSCPILSNPPVFEAIFLENRHTLVRNS